MDVFQSCIYLLCTVSCKQLSANCNVIANRITVDCMFDRFPYCTINNLGLRRRLKDIFIDDFAYSISYTQRLSFQTPLKPQ